MNLNYNSYHAFEYAGTHYLFDNVNLFSCIVPLRTFDALKNKDCSMLNEEDLRLFEEFFKQKVFFIDNPDEQFYSPQYNEIIVSMAVFHGCNLNCKYCFADAGLNYKGTQKGFTNDSINAAVDFLLKDSYFSKAESIRINLVGGGEPLLNKQLFRCFIETVFSRFEKAGKHLYVWFSTNGTLLSVEDLVFISKYNIGYGISIDGDKLDNDKTRIYADGAGTYDDIISTIKKIQQSSMVPKRLKELWGLLVLSKKNNNILKNVQHLYDLGFSTIQMRFVRSNDYDLSLDPNQSVPDLLKFVDQIFGRAINGDDRLLRVITNNSDYIGKIIKRLVTQTVSKIRCSIGSGMFSFAADGKIYPCDCLVGNPEFVMGSFYSSIFPEQYEKYSDLSVSKRQKCSRCWARNVCGGDCYHSSFLKNGNLLTPDESYCKIILNVIEAVIANLNQYRMLNREGYNDFSNFIRIRDIMSSK